MQPQEHPHLVILGVPDEGDLWLAWGKLQHTDIQHVRFHEADLNNSLTAIATSAIAGESRKFFRKFKLLKGA